MSSVRGGNMKVLIMGFSKIKYMPYMNFYLENINTTSNEVHLIYWNRDLQEENTSFLAGVTLHEFCCKQEDDVAKYSKIRSFIKYRKYAQKIIDKEKFDYIIVLHTLPGVLTYNTLCKKYKDKFIFDYRDSTYEGFAPFKKMVGNLVKSSRATFVSSDAFRRFLPEKCKEKIFTSHNLLLDSLSHREEKVKYGTKSDKIRIAFWGFIRHEEINCELIKKIAVDPRFELHYYGREQQVALNLKQYVKDINATNVFFHGEYKPEDRYKFVRDTDIIHNVYNDANMMLAMGNKYYDGIIFRIPQICTIGSHMAVMCEQMGVGVGVDVYSDDFCQSLYSYYQEIDLNVFNMNCDSELKRIIIEYQNGAEIIKNGIL